MITQKGIYKIGSLIQGLVVKGQIKVDEVSKDIPIYRTTIEGDTVKFFLLLDDTITGKIESKQLIDAEGAVIFENSSIVEKDTTRGLLIVFSIKISEVEI